MKLTLLTVGKTDIKWVKEGLDMYAGRLSHYIPFSVTEIPELKNVASAGREQIGARHHLLQRKGACSAAPWLLHRGWRKS